MAIYQIIGDASFAFANKRQAFLIHNLDYQFTDNLSFKKRVKTGQKPSIGLKLHFIS
jgi:hypothetical protein